MKCSLLPDDRVPLLREYGLGNLNTGAAWLFCYEKGECLSNEGQKPEYIQFIISGNIKISVSASNGRTVLLCFDGPGDIIGSIELLANTPYTATAQALTDVHCIAVAMQPHLDFFKTDVDFLNYLCTDLSHAFARSSKNAATNILYPLQTRLCSFINGMAQNGVFCENLTETSELLATSYRHLLRCLDGLCAEGILQKRGKAYHILNAAELQTRAEDYYILR